MCIVNRPRHEVVRFRLEPWPAADSVFSHVREYRLVRPAVFYVRPRPPSLQSNFTIPVSPGESRSICIYGRLRARLSSYYRPPCPVRGRDRLVDFLTRDLRLRVLYT